MREPSRLLDWTGRTGGAGRAELAFLKLEGEDVEETSGASATRLKEGLLFDGRNVQMETDEVDQFSITQAALFNQRTPDFARGFTKKGNEQLTQTVHRHGVEHEFSGRSGAPLDLGLPEGPFAQLADDAKLRETIENQVVAAVGKSGKVGDFARAAKFVDIGKGVVVALPIVLEHHHADDAVAVGNVGNHLAIAR